MPWYFKLYIALVVTLTLVVGVTIFSKPTPEKEEWVQERYKHCYLKHSVEIGTYPELGYTHMMERDRWDWICTVRTYNKPATWE
jgi:hypothetical protein